MNTPVALRNGTDWPPGAPKAHGTASYRCQAKRLLRNSFPRISCAAIDLVLRFYDYNFTNSFTTLSQIENRRAGTDGDGTGLFPIIPNHTKVFIKSVRRKEAFVLNDELLRDEIDAIPELNTKDGVEADDAGGINQANNGNDEAELECLCCYGEYPRTEMRECVEGIGHLVCKQCIYHFVGEQLDGNGSTKFKCIAEPDCEHTYSMVLLDQALTPKLSTRVNDRVFREELEKTGLKSWTCPQCAYIGFIENDYPWIACDQCNERHCTLCNDKYHDNRTCDDVRREKEVEKDPKHRAHEAMSKACKRFCPHCNQEYIKGDGCNKIKCKCKKLSCYLCGDKVQDYSHFCTCGGKCKCGKTCSLFTSTEAMEEIDRQRRHAAGREVLSKAGYTNEREILSLLASPQAKKKVANRAAALPAAARAQQPDHVPVRPPQANPAVAARNVQPRTPPRRRDHAFAAIANNQAALPNVLNLPPTPNHSDPQMEQPLQVRQEPEQPIDDNRAANNAAPPQNHWIRTIMFSFVLFMFFIIISLYDRVNVLSAPGKCMHAPLNGGNLELAWCWNVKQNLHYDASTRQIKIKDRDQCISHNFVAGDVIVQSCRGGKNEKWYYNSHTYELKSLYVGACLERSNDKFRMNKRCGGDNTKFSIPWLSDAELERVSAFSDPGQCMHAPHGRGTIRMVFCQAENMSQEFTYNASTSQMKNKMSGLCVTHGYFAGPVSMQKCDHANIRQKWHYNTSTKELKSVGNLNHCLEWSVDNVSMQKCIGGGNQKFLLPAV